MDHDKPPFDCKCCYFSLTITYAYIGSGPNGNMLDENGSEAVLWHYIFVFPLCLILQIILLVLKLKYLKP